MVKSDERERPLAALTGLLDLFRRGHIIEPHTERIGIKQHTDPLSVLWDKQFPNFPTQYFPYTSFKGEFYRGRRDDYLKKIIVRMITNLNSGDSTIVNPACVFGRHACDLASRLPDVRIIGTDIERFWSRIYGIVRGFQFPDNYSFMRDNVFAPELDVRPTAVVFFGACGAVSDGAMDYAINSGARYLLCRTCCHDNIGGNISVIKRPTYVNRFFRFKNRSFERMISKGTYSDYYFSDRYSHDAYPRSEAASSITTSKELIAVARHSADSDICRAIIDMDRHLYLVEKGFNVLYQGELFVAERK